MLFNSIHFMIFFPLVILLYFSLPHRYRWALLLGASYYFYMSWNVKYVMLLLLTTVVDWYAALRIEQAGTTRRRMVYILVSLILNLSLLFTFKYFNFISDSVRLFLEQISIPMHPLTLKVLLPVGISFYTFQSLGYTLDVYRGRAKAERHIGIFALYVSFFPQLVAGPIERATNLLPQFREVHSFDYARAVEGLRLMLWGFVLKVVIADRLALSVDTVYNNVSQYAGTSLMLATVFFAFQIYCDFAGYSNIAIGAARVMGFRLIRNFNRPYSATSVADFWRRWHISLSTWFRDYVYLPLGGSRVSQARWAANIMIVFLLSGMWHGANWTFFLWGALHGTYMVVSHFTAGMRERLAQLTGLVRFPLVRRSWQIMVTFVLVNIGWVLFRSNSIADAAYVLMHLTTDFSIALPSLNIGLGWFGFAYLAVCILCIIVVERFDVFGEIGRFLHERRWAARWAVYMLVSAWIILFGVFGHRQFIYFQF